MIVKIKKLRSNAVIPKYAKYGDVGMDLTATSREVDEHGNISYGTGLAFEIPEGYFMMLVPRSSNHKTNLILTNHCGICDSGYRGEVFFKYAPYHKKYLKGGNVNYNIGDRIGQAIILPYPKIEFEEVNELSETERGSTGYGSSGS